VNVTGCINDPEYPHPEHCFNCEVSAISESALEQINAIAEAGALFLFTTAAAFEHSSGMRALEDYVNAQGALRFHEECLQLLFTKNVFNSSLTHRHQSVSMGHPVRERHGPCQLCTVIEVLVASPRVAFWHQCFEGHVHITWYARLMFVVLSRALNHDRTVNLQIVCEKERM
jgi:hypothetical protein